MHGLCIPTHERSWTQCRYPTQTSNPADLTTINGPALNSKQILVITAIVLQSPNGDKGRLLIQRGPTSSTPLFAEGLINYRDLDHHFEDGPLLFTKDSPLTVSLNCQKAGVGSTCHPNILFTGRIVTAKHPVGAIS